MEAEVGLIWWDELKGRRWVVVVGAVGKELPVLKIARASAATEKKERERDCGRVLLCLPAGLIRSPDLLKLLKSLLSLLWHYKSLFTTVSCK